MQHIFYFLLILLFSFGCSHELADINTGFNVIALDNDKVLCEGAPYKEGQEISEEVWGAIVASGLYEVNDVITTTRVNSHCEALK